MYIVEDKEIGASDADPDRNMPVWDLKTYVSHERWLGIAKVRFSTEELAKEKDAPLRNE